MYQTYFWSYNFEDYRIITIPFGKGKNIFGHTPCISYNKIVGISVISNPLPTFAKNRIGYNVPYSIFLMPDPWVYMKQHIKNIALSSPLLTKIAFYFRKRSLQRKSNINFGRNVAIGFSSTCEGNNAFGDNTSFIGSTIGFGSYIGPDSKFMKTKIGRFSSIGPNVKCIFGKHPSHTFVSTHPAFFSLRKQAGFTYTKKQRFDEFAEPRDKA